MAVSKYQPGDLFTFPIDAFQIFGSTKIMPNVRVPILNEHEHVKFSARYELVAFPHPLTLLVTLTWPPFWIYQVKVTIRYKTVPPPLVGRTVMVGKKIYRY